MRLSTAPRRIEDKSRPTAREKRQEQSLCVPTGKDFVTNPYGAEPGIGLVHFHVRERGPSRVSQKLHQFSTGTCLCLVMPNTMLYIRASFEILISPTRCESRRPTRYNIEARIELSN